MRPISSSPSTEIKPLLVSTYDIQGGAAVAAYHLHQGLQSIGIDSRMLSYHRASKDTTVSSIFQYPSRWTRFKTRLAVKFDRYPFRFYDVQAHKRWSLNWFPTDSVATIINNLNPDIVHLQWIGDGFVPIRALKYIHKPIVWTQHDLWALTGGCHYAGDCTRYQTACGTCPQLNSNREHDLSRWIFDDKLKHWQGLNLTVVTPSKWLADCTRASTLFQSARVEVIPNGIDLRKYKPIDKQVARHLFNLPTGKKLVLFGAADIHDPRKGFQQLQKALQQLQNSPWKDRIELVVFGAGRPDSLSDLQLPSHYLGVLRDEISLPLAYSAADVFILASREDNLPNTVMEALACGAPCAAFHVGGIPDMVEHEGNGYLARPFDVAELAHGIQWVLENNADNRLSTRARQKIEQEFELTYIAHKYVDLYAELIESASHRSN